jgi:hypothetical protein
MRHLVIERRLAAATLAGVAPGSARHGKVTAPHQPPGGGSWSVTTTATAV